MNAPNPWAIQQQAPQQQRPMYSVNTGYGNYTFPQGNPGGGSYSTNSGAVGVNFQPGQGVTGYSVPTAFGVNYSYNPGQPKGGSYSVPTGFNSGYGYTPGKPGGQFTYAAGGMGVANPGYQAQEVAYNPSAWNVPPVTVIPPPSSVSNQSSGTVSYNPSSGGGRNAYAPEAEERVSGRILGPGHLSSPMPATGGPYGNGTDIPERAPYTPSGWDDDYERTGVQDPYESPPPHYDPLRPSSAPQSLQDLDAIIEWNRQQYYPNGGQPEMSGGLPHYFQQWLESQLGGL